MMVDDAGRGVYRGRDELNGSRSGGRSSGGARIPVAASGLGLVRGVAGTPSQRSFTSVGPAVEGRPYFQWPQQLGRWNGTKFVVSPNCLSEYRIQPGHNLRYQKSRRRKTFHTRVAFVWIRIVRSNVNVSRNSRHTEAYGHQASRRSSGEKSKDSPPAFQA